MNHLQVQYYESPAGELILGDYNGRLCLCDWRHRKKRNIIDDRIKNDLRALYLYEETELIRQATIQLGEYFRKERETFDLPLYMSGSEFQKKVWNELLKIPYGNSDSYSQLATRLLSKKAIRVVASAIGANAISIIIPCHRVIGANNSLVGYAGGLEAKRKLLVLEGSWPRHGQLEAF